MKKVKLKTLVAKNIGTGEEIPLIGIKGEKGDSESGSIDVQINGTSIVDENNVANVPVATDTILGTVMTSPLRGTNMHPSGYITTLASNENDIIQRTNQYKPIVPTNLDYAVKKAMCDGKGAEWTDEEKASARARMGVGGYLELIEEWTNSDSEVRFYRTAEPNGTPYNFKTLHISIEASTTLSGSCNSYFFSENSITSAKKIGYWWTGAKTNTNKQIMYLVGTIVNGVLLGKGNTWTNATTSTAFVSIENSDNILEPNDTIRAFEIGRVPPNAKVKIYGVRA